MNTPTLDDLSNHVDLVEAAVVELELQTHALLFDKVLEDTYSGDLEAMRTDFDALGPFAFARNYKLLVNNSGEETAVKFMSLYNELNPGTY
jgi:hypothetical protein